MTDTGTTRGAKATYPKWVGVLIAFFVPGAVHFLEVGQRAGVLWFAAVMVGDAVVFSLLLAPGNAAYVLAFALGVSTLVAGTINTGIIIAGAVGALATLGVNVTAMVAGLGLTGFAVGFALKDAVSNLVSGLLIVMYSPFDIGDEIEVSGVTGKVADINLRYVTVKTDTDSVMIPNGNFVTNVIKKNRPAQA